MQFVITTAQVMLAAAVMALAAIAWAMIIFGAVDLVKHILAIARR